MENIENNEKKKMKFERYKRGQIVMVNFSPSMGSETANKHLAIVLNKNDSPNNGVLTVIPLTSKCKPYYLDLGEILTENVTYHLENFYQEILRINTKSDIYPKSIKEFTKAVKISQAMNKRSYAMVQNISTISKLRVLKPFNKYDPIANIKVSSETLDVIDSKLIELYCGK